MNRIELDWLARPGHSRLGWVLLAFSLVAALLVVERHRSWVAQAELLETQSMQVRQSTRRSAARVSEPVREQAALQQEVRAANRVIEQLGIPWPELFRDLEAAADPTISLLAIQPDSATRSLRVEGEARDYKSVLGFVERLEATPAFSVVHAVSHQTRVDAPARPVGFALVGAWKADPR